MQIVFLDFVMMKYESNTSQTGVYRVFSTVIFDSVPFLEEEPSLFDALFYSSEQFFSRGA
jgi:hypothetical protein